MHVSHDMQRRSAAPPHKAMSSRKQSLQADVATVLRGKRLMVMPACDLVPGDIVEIAGPFPFTFSCTFGGRC